jgi:hypothetical protein
MQSAMNMVNLLRGQLIQLGSMLRGRVKPELEVVYQSIFDRNLAALDIPNKYYPLGAAANYSLLYLILRSAQELNIKNVVELGAGQSSLLFDALRRKNVMTGSVSTIENDELWASQIRSAVSHDVKCVPLRRNRIGSYDFDGYDLSAIEVPSKIDFLLIDGPVAWGKGRTFARLGALPLLDKLDFEDGFLIVVDDAEREGETTLVDRIGSILRKREIDFKSAQILAHKRQAIFASGKMVPAAFY